MKSKKLSPKEKQVEYLGLAKTYLECGEPKLSLKCLSYAKEFQLSAQLCERLGQVRPSLRSRWENWAALEPSPSAPACVGEGPGRHQP
ncbi:TPR and ankyrin repeat-containing protein 1-like [Crocuta crocuta]